MFLCFYALYGLIYTVFIAGAYADYYCYSANVNEAYGVGVQMLVIPFTVPDYLFRWTGIYKPWKDVANDELLEAYVIAFLSNSFYVDALNSIFQRGLLLKGITNAKAPICYIAVSHRMERKWK